MEIEIKNPKHIIISRKGFDSQNGCIPNPILPDGTLLVFPIPDKNDIENTFFDTNAPPPTAIIFAIPTIITVNGKTILTAASAESPTPWPTNIPSIIVYNDDINIESADGIAYFKNSTFLADKFLVSFQGFKNIKLPFLS